MTQISEGIGFEMIRRLVKGAADYHGADMIVTVCPMCQLNLDAFQGAMNRYFKTSLPHAGALLHPDDGPGIRAWTQAALGIGAEFVDARRGAGRNRRRSAASRSGKRVETKRDDKSLPMPEDASLRRCSAGHVDPRGGAWNTTR